MLDFSMLVQDINNLYLQWTSSTPTSDANNYNIDYPLTLNTVLIVLTTVKSKNAVNGNDGAIASAVNWRCGLIDDFDESHVSIRKVLKNSKIMVFIIGY